MLHEGPVRFFASEDEAIAAIKSVGTDAIKPGDTVVLAGDRAPGIGMPETYQVTSALEVFCPTEHRVALLTEPGDFPGVSTGACVGHISPESAELEARSAACATATSGTNPD